MRLVNAAGGSGAFLLEAFDQFHTAYQEAVDRLEELRGERGLFDPDKSSLTHNLYAVDLNEEDIELCRLSVWIKTAKHGRPLTALDHNFRVGNSLVADPAADPRAFDWRGAFPEVFAAGGFDAVVGTPAYVRQELLGPLKPYLAGRFAAYHGMADLYVYFYELGLELLRPGGRLAYVVTNKWLKTGYGEPLRRHLGVAAWVEALVDLGYAKQVFEDADVFPSLLVARKPGGGPAPDEVRVAVIPRDELAQEELAAQVEARNFAVPRRSLGAAPWSLEPPRVARLLEKIRGAGVALQEYVNGKPPRGVVTGCNEAFMVDTPTRDRLVAEDPKAVELLRPYLRGQDVRRWHPEWSSLWMIFARRGVDIEAYPSILRHLQGFRTRLEAKPAGWAGRWEGRKPGNCRWYELQDPVEYWEQFGEPKILYQDITWQPRFCLDRQGFVLNNTVYFLPTADRWVAAVLNSPAAWWLGWRAALHGKDEALRFFSPLVEAFPVPRPSDEHAGASASLVEAIEVLAAEQQEAKRSLLDWLRVEHGVEAPGLALRDPWGLASDAFVAEVRKARGRRNPLTAAGLKSLRDEHARTIAPRRSLLAEAAALERELAALVHAVDGLTPDDLALLWQTAPPRMPAGPVEPGRPAE